MTELSDLKANCDAAHKRFVDLIAAEFPGATPWHWFRAVSSVAGDNCRRNDDTTRDVEMAAHVGIRAAHDDFLAKLHEYYAARYGPRGVLGSRGL